MLDFTRVSGLLHNDYLIDIADSIDFDTNREEMYSWVEDRLSKIVDTPYSYDEVLESLHSDLGNIIVEINEYVVEEVNQPEEIRHLGRRYIEEFRYMQDLLDDKDLDTLNVVARILIFIADFVDLQPFSVEHTEMFLREEFE